MSELSPELKALVVATKRRCLPTAADSERIHVALRARLGEAAFIGAESVQAVATSASSGIVLGKISVVSLAGLALIGGLWFFAARNHLEAASESKLAHTPTATQEAAVNYAPSEIASTTPSSPELRANDVTATVYPASDHDVVRSGASHHTRDKLADEVALLSRAETALHDGRPTIALEILNEHERKFESGLLAEERIAARVQALCALGRTAAADAQLALLSPRSLHGEASPGACGSRRGK